MGELGGEGERDARGGEDAEGGKSDEGGGEEDGGGDESEAEGGQEGSAVRGGREVDDEEGDDHLRLSSAGVSEEGGQGTHVLDEEEDVLSVRAPGELVADVVRDRDREAGRVEDVAAQAESTRTLASHDLDNLRHLDDAPAEDDPEAEDLGDGVADAVGGIKVGVPHERRVAFLGVR